MSAYEISIVSVIGINVILAVSLNFAGRSASAMAHSLAQEHTRPP
jgi:hypothetical protein